MSILYGPGMDSSGGHCGSVIKSAASTASLGTVILVEEVLRPSEFRSGSAGIHNEAILSCKGRVTKDFVLHESICAQDLRIWGSNFLDVQKNNGFPLEASCSDKIC